MIYKLQLIFCVMSLSVLSCAYGLFGASWKYYKRRFNKTYATFSEESVANKMYRRNVISIEYHNLKYEKGEVSYSLAENQFTDMPFETVQRMFPHVDENKIGLATQKISYSKPFNATNRPYKIIVKDQGLKCNSGWAYAAASSFEYCLKKQDKSINQSVSAQQLIDCLGGPSACSNQTLFTAFPFYENHNKHYFFEDEYPNDPQNGQSECKNVDVDLKKIQRTTCKSLFGIPISNTNFVKHYIGEYYNAITFQFNEISFEFLHYSKGVFTTDPSRKSGSHFMIIVGYDIDSKGNEYWTVLNSFGSKWGEDGYMRLAIGSANLGDSALFFY